MPTIEQVGTYRVDQLFRRVDITDGCWFWRGTLDRSGYGVVSLFGKNYQVHRLVYELLVGPIPKGLVLDHVRARGCISTTCCNPDHLEPVTQSENVYRTFMHGKGRCVRGHALDGPNLQLVHRANGEVKKVCAICSRERHAKYRRSKILPITKSQVRDARPQINAEAESDKKTFTANVAKGFVEIRRGTTKGALLRIKYGETAELHAIIDEVKSLLSDNQYDASESYQDGYEPGEAKYTPENPRGPRAPKPAEQVSDTAGADPTNPVAANTAETTPNITNTGTPAQQAQAEFDAEPARTTSDDNPFA